MYTLTFKLENRVKTFTDTTVEGAYKMFLIGYGEVLNEVQWVELDNGLGSNRLCIKSFRKNFRHIEEEFDDIVTDKLIDDHLDDAEENEIDDIENDHIENEKGGA